jgi:hypothetical protein
VRRTWFLRHCKNGHTYRVVYGDERNVTGMYACVNCPQTSSRRRGPHATPIEGVDIVFDPTLKEIADLRRKIRES